MTSFKVPDRSRSVTGKLWRSWLLIVFLSLLPGFIFLWDWTPDGEKATSLARLSDRWFKKSDALAHRFYEASDRGFWGREFAYNFKQMVEGLSEKLPYSAAFSRALTLNQKRYGVKPLGIFFTTQDNGKSWKLDSSEPLPSLFLVRQLFTNIVSQEMHGSGELKTKVWDQRLKTIFGAMSYSEMFESENRLKAFPIVFQKKSWHLVWDYLQDARGINAGYFLLFPADFNESQDLSDRYVQRWQAVIRDHSMDTITWPAIVVLNDPENLQIKLPEEIDQENFRIAFEDFVRQKFKPVTGISGAVQRETPAEMSGKSIFIGDKIARLCYTSPESGFCGFLIAPSPDLPFSLRTLVAVNYFKAMGLFWCLFVVRLIIFRKLPPITIGLRVLVWFLAFAAFPAGLSIGAWTAIMQEFRDLKVLRLQRDLHQLALNVDADIAVLSNTFLRASREAMSAPGLKEQVLLLAKDPGLEAKIFSRISETYMQRQISPPTLMFVVQGGWCFTSYARGFSERMQKSTRLLVGAVLDKFLGQADQETYRALKPDKPGVWADKRVNSIADATDFNIYENFGSVRDRFDNVTGFLSGNNFAQQFYHQINVGEKPFAIFVSIWEPERYYLQILKESLPVQALYFRKISDVMPDLAVFKGFGDNLRLIHSTGNKSGMARMAFFDAEAATFFSDHENASILVPSQRMPGHSILVRASIENVNRQVFHEKAWMLLSLSLITMSILGGSLWVTIWFSKPLRGFIKDLVKLRSGLPSGKHLEIREDEIGAMSRTIKRMSDWIVEREKIKKFVAPQAIRAVADGNLMKAGAGSLREAIILVSDIRSFTTISEEYPVEEVFDMVNQHLGEMAKIIESHGGFIDRFVGDAVWAVFYEDESSQARAAFSSAVSMMRKHLGMMRMREEKGQFLFKIGIGLARGTVLAGIMGSSSVKLDYTIVGETLQTAEEVESASKLAFNTGIVFDKSLAKSVEAMKIEFVELADHADLFEVKNLD